MCAVVWMDGVGDAVGMSRRTDLAAGTDSCRKRRRKINLIVWRSPQESAIRVGQRSVRNVRYTPLLQEVCDIRRVLG